MCHVCGVCGVYDVYPRGPRVGNPTVPGMCAMMMSAAVNAVTCADALEDK